MPPLPPSQPNRPRAIAMRYRENQDQAPRLVAKGEGSIAERILALAKEHGIPLYEDEDLIALLGVLDLDVEIPPRMYRALAEVLAHVHRVEQGLR